jgi:hypothetical protein
VPIIAEYLDYHPGMAGIFSSTLLSLMGSAIETLPDAQISPGISQ